MIRFFARLFNIILIASLLLTHAGNAFAQDSGEDEFVARLIAQMSPEAKVGQLFVVSFKGTETTLNSDVADLILNYRVGGIVLSIQNGNIINDADAPTQVATLTAALQNLSRQAARINATPFIPLFAATEQDGDGAPHSQISTGLTPLPSPMALGATWNADYAEKVGEIAGRELSALGINLLLGPSLDVRTSPSNTS
ncbi:MAG TPA: glycoside hydrolase family 3 N-terminal domain-containing protein, partial [Anaerolineae bacterium]|nr:glycoside hydrolase family 3 N-terminal domain-containing protein [Anaerolineae bacterium]